ncbi:MAG: helix-turn-helix domain-containing protein [Acidimicrobiales bacterium]|jgi:excisionase family DNA binding protein
MSTHGESRLLLTIDETCECLHVSRPIVYRLIHEGALRSIVIGRARRVPVLAVEAYIAEQMRIQGSDPAA